MYNDQVFQCQIARHSFLLAESDSLHFSSSPETQKNGLVLLYDMTESGYQNFDYNLARKVMNLLKVTKTSLKLVLKIFTTCYKNIL